MSASAAEYEKMFGSICENSQPMARCNCTACNSCTCGCSCRNIPEFEDIEW